MLTVGWKEWVEFVQFNLPPIEAKIDTGAKTSCLHAFKVEPFDRNGQAWVRFWMHPHRNDLDDVRVIEAKVVDQRQVSDSGGHKELRYVIETEIRMGAQCWLAEITLTNRDSMQYRMLLGRQAMKHKILVNPSRTHLLTHQQQEQS